MRRGTGAGSLSGWVAFAGPLAFYIATLSPGVAFWDIGEMQTVPYMLGIPHPTGFPFFLLVGWIASHAFVVGDPAWRMSLLCAIASAASAWLAWSFVRDATESGPLGLAAAMAFSLGDIVWTRAVRADVHDVALLCIVAAIVAAKRASDTGSQRWLAIAALACGLGLATHPVILFAIPCVFVIAWPALRAASRASIVRAISLAVAPLFCYAYFPLRSSYVEAHGLDPNEDLGLSGSALFDDGSPSSPGRFWQYVSGSDFAPGHAAGHVFSTAGFAHAFAFASALVAREFSPPLLAFAAIGVFVLCFSQPRVAIGFGTFALADVAFVSNYAVEVDPDRYALATLWIVVCCAAIGVRAAYVPLLRDRPRWGGTLCAATLLLTLWPSISFAYDDVRERTAYEDARDLAPQIVRRTSDGSVFVATWNFATPLLYDRYVAGTFGHRHVVCGWPPAFGSQLRSWRERFGHVYFVVSSTYDVSPMGRRIYARGRWQLAEMR